MVTDQQFRALSERVARLEASYERSLEFISGKLVGHTTQLEDIESKLDALPNVLARTIREEIDASVDKLGKSLSGVLDDKFAKANADSDAKFAKVSADMDAKFAKASANMDRKFETMGQSLSADLDRKFETMGQSLSADMDRKFETMEQRLAALLGKR